MDHRGVIQAQGGNLQASRSWDQATALSAATGYAHLESLKDEIGKRETELRKEGFTQARVFIDRMLARGGTEVGSASYPKELSTASSSERETGRHRRVQGEGIYSRPTPAARRSSKP